MSKKDKLKVDVSLIFLRGIALSWFASQSVLILVGFNLVRFNRVDSNNGRCGDYAVGQRRHNSIIRQ